jgi:predicted DNA-binding mobile mystery protein A
MKGNFSDLKLRQLDTALTAWRNARLPPRPSSGWIKAIREGLGMAATHLAAKLGVTTSTVTRLESSEADDTISLGTLRRAAEALGCDPGTPADGLRQPHHGPGSPIDLA